jgi:hypothetical protein
MTLGELIARENLVGRTVELHDAQSYFYSGAISAVANEGGVVKLALTSVVQSFKGGGEYGRTKQIPGFLLKLKEDTPVHLSEETLHFTLPDGGRGYILPAGRKPPEPAKEDKEE